MNKSISIDARISSNMSVLIFFFRHILVSELVGGKWETQQSVPIRFYEYEASVPGLLSRLKEALGTEEDFVLADSQGLEIIDCDGTKGACVFIFYFCVLCSD